MCCLIEAGHAVLATVVSVVQRQQCAMQPGRRGNACKVPSLDASYAYIDACIEQTSLKTGGPLSSHAYVYACPFT